MSKKTVVLGASTNPEKYANIAVHRLANHGHEVVPIGRTAGAINGVAIQTGQPQLTDIHTVTMYLNPFHQQVLYPYILGLKPKRIIFNPGTENKELAQLAANQGIEVLNACTLVMLSINDY